MADTPRSHLRFPPEVLVRAQGAGAGIKAAIFDVDGVLTDGTIWITEAGETLKNFNVLDGQGLLMLRKGGITPIVITGRDSAAVRRRVSDLGGRVLQPPLDLKSRRAVGPGRHALVPIAGPPGG